MPTDANLTDANLTDSPDTSSATEAETTTEVEIEALVELYLSGLRRGERPTIESFAVAHPALADEIRDLFPLVAAMEGWKEEETSAQGGNNSLGGVQLQQLGDFRIVREIGRGGMGIVFEAIQETLDRPVAIKILPPTIDTSKRAGERFRREARTAASLHHSNIVPVFGIGHENGFSYIVMQRIDGCGLDQILQRHRHQRDRHQRDRNPTANPWLANTNQAGLEPRLVARLGLQATAALQYAHEAGTLHRDIKPANLLLDQAGHLWVADFGLARALEQETLSHSGDIVGTLLYLAPERFAGNCDARSDVYSLGLTLIELLRGSAFFDTSDSGTLVERILRGVPSRPGSLGMALPSDLETILLKAIAVEPRDRYQSADALGADLQAFLDDRAINARPPTRIESVRRWCRRNPAVASLLATVATLLLLTAVLTTAGLLQQRRMRARTEAVLDTTLDALDTMYNRFASPAAGSLDPLAGTATLSEEAASLLQQMLQVYDELASQGADTNKLLREATVARLRVADIHLRLGAPRDAATHYQRVLNEIDELQLTTADDQRVWGLRQHQALLGLAATAEWERDFATAESLKRRALAKLTPLQSTFPANADLRLALAQSHYLLGRKTPSLISAPASRQVDRELARPSFRPGNQPPGRFGNQPGGRRGGGPGGPPNGFPQPQDRPGRFLREQEIPFGGPARRDWFRQHIDAADAGPKSEPEHAPAPPAENSLANLTGDKLTGDKQFYDEADRRAHLETALSLLAELGPGSQAQYWRAITLHELAKLGQQPLTQNIQWAELAKTLLTELAHNDQTNPDHQFELARVLLTACELRLQNQPTPLEELPRIESQLNQVIALLRPLRQQQPQIPEYTSTLARACEALALVDKKLAIESPLAEPTPQGVTADSLIQEAIQLQQLLVNRFPDSLNQQWWLLRYQTSQLLIALGRRGGYDWEQPLDEIRTRLEDLTRRARQPHDNGLSPIAGGREFQQLAESLRAELDFLESEFQRPGRPFGRRGPEGRGPEGRGPEGRGPEGRGPEGRGPEGRGPDFRGPDGRRGQDARREAAVQHTRAAASNTTFGG